MKSRSVSALIVDDNDMWLTRLESIISQKLGYACDKALSYNDAIALLGKKEYDCEGRVLGARFGKLHLVTAYYPNSQEGGKRLDYKVRFCKAIQKKSLELNEKGHDIVLCGDYNIAHTQIDLARPKPNEASPGYFPQERQAMTDFLKAGFVDIFREQNPGLKDQYTWWSYRGGARQRNVGWRIDYTNISPGLKSRAKKAFHYRDVLGIDHCLICLTLK